MLEGLGKSQLVPALLPTALDILDNQTEFQEMIGYFNHLPQNTYTQATLELLKKLDWQAETSTISNVIEELLQIGSVEEIIEYINNPDFLLDLPNEKLRKLGHALNYISQLELLHASTIGLEYFLQQQSTHNLITWHEDPYTYLHERLEFFI